MNDYRLESPPILRDFLSYHETIKAHSQKTVDEYFLDLRNFFRYLKQSHDPSLRDLPLSEISIMDVDLDFVKKVTLTDIYAYMTYLSRDRVQHQNSDVSDYGLPLLRIVAPATADPRKFARRRDARRGARAH